MTTGPPASGTRPRGRNAPAQRPHRLGQFGGVQSGRQVHRHRQWRRDRPHLGRGHGAASAHAQRPHPPWSAQRRTVRTASTSSPPVTTRPPASGTRPRGRQCAQLSGHTGVVSSAAYSPDGQFIVTASNDQTARIWEAATGRQNAPTHAATPPLSTRRPTVPTASSSSPPVRTRPPASGTRPRGRRCVNFSGHTDSVSSAAYSPDGKFIVTASDD